VPTVTCYGMEIGDFRVPCSSLYTRNGRKDSYPNRTWNFTLETQEAVRRQAFLLICYRTTTTSSAAQIAHRLDQHLHTTGLIPGLLPRYNCMTQGFEKERSAMVNKPNSNAAKNILWPGATPFLALLSRQSPFGLRGSLPATVNSLRCLQFVCCPVLANIPWQFGPGPSGKSCQKLLAVLATNLATERRRCYAAA